MSEPWTVEDSLPISELAEQGAIALSDILLPSGRRLTAEQLNELSASYAEQNREK